MQNQLDWIHVVTDYYPEGSLNDMLMRRGNTFKEYELQKLAKSLLSAVSYCHTELGIVLTNLNPESVAAQFKDKMYHTRLINLSHHFKGTEKMIADRELKDRLGLITNIGDHDTVKFPAFFMAPEQVNFGLYLYKGEEDDAWQLNSEEEEAERKR